MKKVHFMVKKAYHPLLKGVNWVLAGLLSVLGFSGCDNGNETLEYGSPYATFTFHGKVTNQAGEPVPDIKIEVNASHDFGNPALSDATGHYSALFQAFPVEDFQVIASDIDGEANGSYRNDTIQVKVGKEDYYEKKSGNWNYGSAAKEVNIELKEKE
ncbi:MAG: radical SAM-associated putative lipoprotein [Tannerella sp.]|jgi:putative lipoprotein (rSAM/lipoprotein system)|nr:radical SAM-associated putative lipoprotein [Tannerella sp.]